MRSTTASQPLILNMAPLHIHGKWFKVGKLPFQSREAYRKLRDDYWQTHAFRYDSRVDLIFNVPIKPDVTPLGEEAEMPIEDHLLLTARAIQQAILVKIANRNVMLAGDKKLLFLGQAEQSLLLSKAANEVGVTPVPGLEVAIKYEIDCRLFDGGSTDPFLGLVIDVSTSNRLDVPASTLAQNGISPVGKTIFRREKSERPYLSPRLTRLGVAISSEGGKLTISGPGGVGTVSADQALLEPRLEIFNAAVRAMYGRKGEAVLRALKLHRYPFTTAAGKLGRIKETLASLQKRSITISNGVEVTIGSLLESRDALFPSRISTDRPVFRVGPQGNNTAAIPDQGIKGFGPYKYMQHAKNRPLVAVLCESHNRGRVDQFLQALKYGFPEEHWSTEKPGRQNPFEGGLVGKFRLVDVKFEVEELTGASSVAYKEAAERLLGRLPETPHLAIIQTKQAFKALLGGNNPYFVSKATFMRAGVPTQAITIENIDDLKPGVAYILNQLALACYAKMDGIPWVISVKGPSTHELILGIGSSEVPQGDADTNLRYVGVTSVFQGDGRYMVWGITREAVYERYAEVLLESLRTTIRYVQAENDWQTGDEVRLIFHVYKRLKDAEIEAIKGLVDELVKDKYNIKFAFLDLSWSHPYHIIAPQQKGVPYGNTFKGAGVSDRGLCLQLSKYRGLLNLTGPSDVKTGEQGLPKPLLVDLNPDSDFDDLPYLMRQIFHFTFMSWQNFFPASEPVTIRYSRMISKLLGNLNTVPGWDSTNLTIGNLRGRRWFL